MRLTKKICTVILCLAFTAVTALALTACGNEKYENGVLYNGTAVIGADPSATSITVKDGTRGIAREAFSGCNGLTVKIGDVSYVDGWVTDIQPSVTTLELSDSIAGIADGAFTDAVNLECIVFTGAAEEWELLKDSIPTSVIEKINVTITPNKT